ncbi:MAG: MATE family efflux transporter [Deltaproteobacteria bacterium]|nr:MATE family efflux transporter [Deltaproteobacteria bacterium]
MTEKTNPDADGPSRQEGESLYGKILALAVPLILANLVQQVYNLIDVFFLGRYRGSLELAAAGVSMQVSWALIYMFVGLSVGASIVTAQSYGAKDPLRLGRAVHTTAAMSLASGVVLVILGLIFAGTLLRLINTPDEVFPKAASYLRIHFLSMFPYIIYTMGSAVLRGVGDTRTAMKALSVSLCVKFVFALILVAFMGGGVEEAAYGTILAQISAAAVVTRKLVRADGPHKLWFGRIAFHWKTLAKIAAIGVPAGLQSLVQYLANFYFQSQVNVFGPDVVAALVTYTRLEGFVYMPIEAFALAAATLSGQNLGARNFPNIPRVMRETSRMSVGVTFFFSLMFMLLAPHIVAYLNPENPRAANIALLFMSFFMPVYFLYSLTQNFGGVIRGTGEARIPMTIVLVFTCGVRVVWISFVNDSLVLLALTYPISWTCTFLAYVIYYKKGNWLTRHAKDAN